MRQPAEGRMWKHVLRSIGEGLEHAAEGRAPSGGFRRPSASRIQSGSAASTPRFVAGGGMNSGDSRS